MCRVTNQNILCDINSPSDDEESLFQQAKSLSKTFYQICMIIVKTKFLRKEFIGKNRNNLQSSLETIADFIGLGEGVV